MTKTLSLRESHASVPTVFLALVEVLGALCYAQALTNVTLSAKKREFAAHKLVLSVCSGYTSVASALLVLPLRLAAHHRLPEVLRPETAGPLRYTTIDDAWEWKAD